LTTTGLAIFIFFHRCRKKGSKAVWENRSAIKSIVFGGGKKEKKKKKKKGKKNKNKNKSG